MKDRNNIYDIAHDPENDAIWKIPDMCPPCASPQLRKLLIIFGNPVKLIPYFGQEAAAQVWGFCFVPIPRFGQIRFGGLSKLDVEHYGLRRSSLANT